MNSGTSSTNAKPLAGLTVLDLTHMLSGPYAGMILADLGANSVKVEPLHGEGTRKLLASDPRNSIDGMGAYFITLNRNKRSVCVDLKSEEGLEVFYDLVRNADIVLSNFGAGVAERLNIGFEQLKDINPAIITCTVTGFGSDGPGYKRPAFDQVAQAYGGGMSITGTDSAHPMRAGIPIGDLGGGMFAVMGLLSAVIERFRTGQGQHVDISMQDVQISLLNYMATMHFLSGDDPEPIGNAHFVHVPYNSYATKDGHLVIAVITDNFWTNLKQVVQRPEFDKAEYDGQPGRLADKELIDSLLQETFAEQPTSYWLAALNEKRIPCAPINRFSDALNDEQVQHRNMVVDLYHPNGSHTQGPGNPIKFSRTHCEDFAPAPLTGADTQAVLAELLGYSDDRIQQLASNGTINGK